MKDSKEDYLKINKAAWDQKTAVHYDSDFYDVKNFIAGQTSLNEIELNLLPDLKGKKVLHLQCHFGQDTIALSRMGADVTGVDLSDAAIAKANELAQITESSAQFICCDIYDLPNHLDDSFDLIFMSYGTIGWLPDLDQWAQIVTKFLKPTGEFLLVEFHPFIWMYDDDFKDIIYSYFNVAPIVENVTGTYTDQDAPLQAEMITWNHPISEVMNALLKVNIFIQSFNEYDYSPYDCLRHMEEFEPGKYRLKNFGDKIPMVYALHGRQE
ncbi:class I SAM-dependent methyltransferase [Crocinitomix catalasitica]|uniref:class I SAM-dependent methyltransferase n=1 Tax=Crocinitomix catalasitica TaxID=184607 RepID=UPI0004833943|nr:class I SAM-dependent methyltransferase [Crocinitomix catalasitica]